MFRQVMSRARHPRVAPPSAAGFAPMFRSPFRRNLDTVELPEGTVSVHAFPAVSRTLFA
ncbi:hypothetical protein B0G38_002108 [Arthrobacter sp. VKM Ac-2550]|nr:hypothetical protein [Arthrobacter sp. VKM Ac-2550]